MVTFVKSILKGSAVVIEKNRVRNPVTKFVSSPRETMLLLLPEAPIYDKKFTVIETKPNCGESYHEIISNDAQRANSGSRSFL